MRLAQSPNTKIRLDAYNCERGTIGYCPVCLEQVKNHVGDIKRPYFAHSKNSDCISTHWDMSDWHIDWQNKFPIENQEIVEQANDEIHRADVLINNTVIEFQHSPINKEDFDNRCRFWIGQGKNIVWLFDLQDKTYKLNWSNDIELKAFEILHQSEYLFKANLHFQINDNTILKVTGGHEGDYFAHGYFTTDNLTPEEFIKQYSTN